MRILTTLLIMPFPRTLMWLRVSRETDFVCPLHICVLFACVLDCVLCLPLLGCLMLSWTMRGILYSLCTYFDPCARALECVLAPFLLAVYACLAFLRPQFLAVRHILEWRDCVCETLRLGCETQSLHSRMCLTAQSAGTTTCVQARVV